jgi:hypothetical protein
MTEKVTEKENEITARLDKIEHLLGLQRLKQGSDTGAEDLRANSGVSDHCGSGISNHCALQ